MKLKSKQHKKAIKLLRKNHTVLQIEIGILPVIHGSEKKFLKNILKYMAIHSFTHVS